MDFEVIDNRKLNDQGEAKPKQPKKTQLITNITDQLQVVTASFGTPKPIFDRVLVKRMSESDTLNWGGQIFYIPDSAKKSSQIGIVVATADFHIIQGTKFPMDEIVKVGDEVTFGKYSAEEVEIDGEKLVLINVRDIKGRKELLSRSAEAVIADVINKESL